MGFHRSNIVRRLWHIVNVLQSTALCPVKGRVLLLRLLGVNLHKSARIAPNVFIGADNLVMKAGTFINVGAFIDGSASVVLDEFVRIGPYTKILTGTHGVRNNVIRRWEIDTTIGMPVHVRRGCWVGVGSTILPGVTIAEGCVIAAGAVVVKNTEPNGMYSGVPARRTKDLPVNEPLPQEYQDLLQ